MSLTTQQRERIGSLVEALRSGKYKQCRESLRSEDGSGFCCLGVACDLAKDELKVEWEKEKDTGVFSFLGLNGTLANEVITYYGFTAFNPILKFNGKFVSCIALNDKLKESFSSIATALEENYLVDNV